MDKTAGTPDKCFIDNTDITEKTVPKYLGQEGELIWQKEELRNLLEVEQMDLFLGYLESVGKKPIYSVIKDKDKWLKEPPEQGDYTGILRPRHYSD